MLILGLTGGIATGKSTVSKRLQECGVKVVDADVVAREVVEPGTSAYKKIVSHFGGKCDDLVNNDGTLNRPALGRVVFGNEPERKVLNGIVHPAVRYETFRQVAVAWITGHRLVVLDVPLLFESGFSNFCGKTVAVVCNEQLEMDRLLARNDYLTREDAEKRIASQMPLDRKRELADVVIENDGELQELYDKVDAVVAQVMPNKLLVWTEWLVPPVGVLVAVVTFLQRRFCTSKSKL